MHLFYFLKQKKISSTSSSKKCKREVDSSCSSFLKLKLNSLKERRSIKIENKIIRESLEEIDLKSTPRMKTKEIDLKEKKELIIQLSKRDKGLKNDMKSKRTQISKRRNRPKHMTRRNSQKKILRNRKRRLKKFIFLKNTSKSHKNQTASQ